MEIDMDKVGPSYIVEINNSPAIFRGEDTFGTRQFAVLFRSDMAMKLEEQGFNVSYLGKDDLHHIMVKGSVGAAPSDAYFNFKIYGYRWNVGTKKGVQAQLISFERIKENT